MPARTIGTATISFGLVSVPVNLFSSSESSAAISFNMLHSKCGSRLKQQYICAQEGVVVEKDEVTKGYEFSKGQYVRFTAEEIKALDEKATNTIDIGQFVPLAAVDRIYLEKVYYLGAGKGGERAYKLLVAALRDTGRAALGQYSARGKQYLVLVRPMDDLLVMEQLHYASVAQERRRGAPPRRADQGRGADAGEAIDPAGLGRRVRARELSRHGARARARGHPGEDGRPGDHRRARGAADEDHRSDGRPQSESGQGGAADKKSADDDAKSDEKEPAPKARKKAGGAR